MTFREISEIIANHFADMVSNNPDCPLFVGEAQFVGLITPFDLPFPEIGGKLNCT